MSVMPAFVPTYQAVLGANDLITAVLLVGQIYHLRSRALLVLALGYLFTTIMVIAHALSFPGAFSTSGLLGAGPQSTAWLYMFWHGGFPIFVIIYAVLMERPGHRDQRCRPYRAVSGAVVLGVVAVVCIAMGLMLLATRERTLLPVLLVGNVYSLA
jgi:hypothetical protein